MRFLIDIVRRMACRYDAKKITIFWQVALGTFKGFGKRSEFCQVHDVMDGILNAFCGREEEDAEAEPEQAVIYPWYCGHVDVQGWSGGENGA